jgi:plastocyanin
MNSLDSRYLKHGDTFAQKFSQPGRYSYSFNLAGLYPLDDADGRFIINVKDSNKQGRKQHNVVVRQHDNKQLVAEPAELNIEAGDMVMWSTFDSATPAFSVSGNSEKHFFDSGALTQEALYTHAFGTEGEIHWGDANGQELAGKIVVKMPRTESARDMKEYRGTLSKGTLVVINGAKAEPAVVEISVGQTVFFAVEKADGVTITDRRLMFKMDRTSAQ